MSLILKLFECLKNVYTSHICNYICRLFSDTCTVVVFFSHLVVFFFCFALFHSNYISSLLAKPHILFLPFQWCELIPLFSYYCSINSRIRFGEFIFFFFCKCLLLHLLELKKSRQHHLTHQITNNKNKSCLCVSCSNWTPRMLCNSVLPVMRERIKWKYSVENKFKSRGGNL